MSKKTEKTHINDVLDGLVEAVSKIMDYRVGVAMGLKPPKGHENYNAEEQKYLIDLVKPILDKAQQSRTIEANSSRDVIKLLTNGKITPNEAKELLMVMKDQTLVEEKEIKVGLQKNIADVFTNKS
jgi:hypothetical protein